MYRLYSDSRPSTGYLAATLFLAGCGSAPIAQPAPVVTPVDAELLAQLPAPMIDSAADQEALSALKDLDFGNSAKGGGPVRWVSPDLSPDDSIVARYNATTLHRGGAAAVRKFDIDVESFLSNRRVQYYENYFTGPSRGRFNVWLGRMERYEGMIRNLFRRYGVPEDMLYLALIESGYSPTAVSRASAVGMWQFMAATGRRYGLRIDAWVDERRDPFKATDAAARHLADLKDQFGAWYLAAAAYNGGPGRVARGLRRLRNDQPVSDATFFALSNRRYLRRETRDYVPKLIAATLIATSPEEHGFNSVPRLAPLVFDEITVPGQTGLDVLAQLADTTARALMELNPQYYRGVTPRGEAVKVRVPRGSGPRVMRRYEDLPIEDRMNFIEHRIRRGETLGEIAERYRVSLRYVMQANPGIRPRALRVGRRITIPMSRAVRNGLTRR